jgi:hypothetical protein
MKIKNAQYFAEMYFVLRRFPFDFQTNLSSGDYKYDVERYCQNLLKNVNIREKISKDMDQEMVPSNMEHIIR